MITGQTKTEKDRVGLLLFLHALVAECKGMRLHAQAQILEILLRLLNTYKMNYGLNSLICPENSRARSAGTGDEEDNAEIPG